MFDVTSPLKIEPDPQGGWQLVSWTGRTFDYKIPFRAMLADVVGALGQDLQSELQLPAYDDTADFVECTLRYRARTLGIYYEHSLGYLAIRDDSEETLREVAKRMEEIVTVAEK